MFSIILNVFSFSFQKVFELIVVNPMAELIFDQTKSPVLPHELWIPGVGGMCWINLFKG